ncbi:EndoU domain-containing protein [Bifidobacterium stellenboschense]|uniref:EndoU domain-containing protein n=1 Tax=Bifidobacterium stellenboschense TaxID=762211 RepID=UPI003B75CC76
MGEAGVEDVKTTRPPSSLFCFRKPLNRQPKRLRSGGHGQTSMEIMDLYGIEYHVVVTYPNGVRAGYVPNHHYKPKRSGTRQTWFPQHWREHDITKAAEHVMKLKSNQNAPDGHIIWGTWRNVRVGVIKRGGLVNTVFPAEIQPSHLWLKNRKARKTEEMRHVRHQQRTSDYGTIRSHPSGGFISA